MVYVVTGDNSFMIQEYVRTTIAQFSGDEVIRLDGDSLTTEQLPDIFTGISLFASQRLVILRAVSANKPLWESLPEWLEKTDNETLLVEPKLDKRTKTYKWLEKHATMVDYRELPPYELEAWLITLAREKNLDLTSNIARFLVEYVGADQWQLMYAVEKIVLSQQKPDEALIRSLIEPTPQATSFEVLDAVFAGDRTRLEALLETVMRDEDPYQFFGLLVSQIYALALVQAGKGKPQDVIAKEGGVHPFVIRKLSPIAQRVHQSDIRDMTTRLAELDANMKSLSTPPWVQLRAFLLAITVQ